MQGSVMRAKAFQLTVAILALAVAGFAQHTTSPVTTAAREILEARQKFLVAAAEAMPDEKYGFKPTPQQMSFGATVAHVAENNYMVCSKLAGTSMPQPLPAGKEAKTRLVAGLRESFEFCSGVLHKLDESMLGQTIDLYGGSTRGKALFYLTGHWADHYSGMAMYLRLNGLLPPTAKQ